MKVLSNFFWNGVLTITVVVMIGVLFEKILSTPVMEVAPNGVCLRVLDGDGTEIKNGCKEVKKGNLATEHRYVGK